MATKTNNLKEVVVMGKRPIITPKINIPLKDTTSISTFKNVRKKRWRASLLQKP
jgi:hypothetical protein